MRNMKKIFAVMLVLAMVLSLAACGGSSSSSTKSEKKEEKKEEKTYETYKFNLGKNWEVNVYETEVKTDKDENKDALYLYVEATLSKDAAKEMAFSDTLNQQAYQGETKLNMSSAKDGDKLIADFSVFQEKIQPGKSIKGVLGYYLVNETDAVKVVFHGYTSDIEKTECTFEIKDRIPKK